MFDPDPDGYRSPWRTFRQLLETTPAWASHRAQIQDDATVCPGLADAVDRICAAHPDRLILLYVGGRPWAHAKAIRVACDQGLAYAEIVHRDAGHWTPCVSTVWPAALIPRLLEYVDAQGWPPEFNADDEIVGRFVREIGHTPLATVPSLVQHEDMTQSLKGQRTRFGEDPNRCAVFYVGDCSGCDARTIDWENGLHPA